MDVKRKGFKRSRRKEYNRLNELVTRSTYIQTQRQSRVFQTPWTNTSPQSFFCLHYHHRTQRQMSVHAARLSRLFTPEYARRINAQLVHPAQPVVVKPNELESALSRPINVSIYEPHRDAAYLAATLSYGTINGTGYNFFVVLFVFIGRFWCADHPFLDGNKRTGMVHSEERRS